ncbi:uncharacterized protein LOC141619116 [Silene latifolia]|uniref:uncharacterized protein LOC141619116 n=1 Tax=Silene latifolia TaxID=37657 RepID=UPI003D76C62C
MGLTVIIMCLKCAIAATLILSVFAPGIQMENLGCSLQGLELDKCLNQKGEYVLLEPCCRALNMAIRTGIHCLCSVLMTNTPEFTTLFSWSMSGCYISVPPMTICRDMGTMPITLPIDVHPYTPPRELPSARTNQLVPAPPPPRQVNVSSIFSTSNNNSNAVKNPAELNKNVTPKFHVSEVLVKNASGRGRDYATGVIYSFTWLLSLAAVYAMSP